ncbi:hypothetical protein DO97_10840 [Neosynechococcus sphagnicola sy1]|uniref:Gfo/Idh/MocA-like oxidoreductase N-terminal domain-containing protein n=1 Tax=Neosynechococcus sphagnicola sy1 TaxID=1497020 RepID=A0A098TJH1_9CYAN|nr:Gfo/Idh/MocA family oxidoreductase [Neosynechococcus sphagnicola]KGF72296.1 hypothetical protein DO97_10840 [Neosynechococcus sphagnicola sy1]
MSTPQWQVGIIGCGRIAGILDFPGSPKPITTHAQALDQHPQFQVAAVVDASLERRSQFQQIWQVPRAYGSLSELLAQEQLDVISLCSPNPWHYQQAVEILTASVPPQVLLVEKPVCQRSEELAHLLQLHRIVPTQLIVNHTRRFDPAHRRAAALLQSGQLGSLVNGRGIYYGGWLNNGVHLIDTLRLLLGQELQVMAVTPSPGGRGTDDNFEVQIQIGESVVVLEGFDEQYYQLFELDLRCQLGRVCLQDFGSQIGIAQVAINNLGERVLVPQLQLQGLASPNCSCDRGDGGLSIGSEDGILSSGGRFTNGSGHHDPPCGSVRLWPVPLRPPPLLKRHELEILRLSHQRWHPCSYPTLARQLHHRRSREKSCVCSARQWLPVSL